MFYGLVEETSTHHGDDELIELKEDEAIVKLKVS